MPSFEELVAEGGAEPTEGWDFSWFDGRATEERPPWGYARLAADHIGGAREVLDVQTGGAEVYAEALSNAASVPARIAATEEWPPNLDIARERLAPLGGEVVNVAATDPLPFDDGAFDLVLARHPSGVPWEQIARVLTPGGTFLAQLVGRGTNQQLYEFFLGPQGDAQQHQTHKAVIYEGVADAGLRLSRLEEVHTKVEFFDVGAVVYFLRKVVWTVPGFTVEKYDEQLRRMHEHIEREGSFVSYSRRFLVEATR